MTATPSVPPRRRVASLTAEPTPAFARGTTSMIVSVAGALVKPIPVPKRTICAAIVPRRPRVARGRNDPGDEDRGHHGDRHHGEEDARPREALEQPAADDRPH